MIKYNFKSYNYCCSYYYNDNLEVLELFQKLIIVLKEKDDTKLDNMLQEVHKSIIPLEKSEKLGM